MAVDERRSGAWLCAISRAISLVASRSSRIKCQSHKGGPGRENPTPKAQQHLKHRDTDQGFVTQGTERMVKTPKIAPCKWH